MTTLTGEVFYDVRQRDNIDIVAFIFLDSWRHSQGELERYIIHIFFCIGLLDVTVKVQIGSH